MEYQIAVYHGTNRVLKKSDLIEFQGRKKKGQQQYGVGFYSTPNYSYARNYGCTVMKLDLVLNDNALSSLAVVEVSKLIEFVKCNFSRKLHKQFSTDFSGKTEVSLKRFYTYISNNVQAIHKYDQVLNDLFVSHGAKYTIEKSTEGYLIIIHDFSIIKNVQKALSYDDYSVPEELIKLSYKWI